MRCTHAEKTDVYIGLDYPLKDEHWEGYKKISTYLDSIKETHPFKHLYIVKRDKNYGFGPNGNFLSLRKEILKNYDSIIVSEDDNVFYPAFLDYCNKGLELFKDDKSVIGICGYRNYYDFKFSNNTFARQGVDFLAWGYGTWKSRVEEWEEIYPSWFRNRFSFIRFIKLCHSNGNYRGLCWLQYCLRPKRNFTLPDDGLSVYMALLGKYTIMPYKTLVKNTGIDGSGVHFKKVRKELKYEIEKQEQYTEPVFEYKGTGKEYYKHNMKINVSSAYKRIPNSRFVYEIVKMFFDKFKTAIKKI